VQWDLSLRLDGFSTIADEVVGVLRAFGSIVGVSEAILGVTVFAMVFSCFEGVDNNVGKFVCPILLPMLLLRKWGFL
jgi:hypothetical protein